MRMIREIVSVCLLAIILFSGCSNEIERYVDDEGVPLGYARLDVNLVAVNGKVFVTRAEADPVMSFIDDVHLLIFEDANTDGKIEETDSLIIRNFYEYGIKQNIYLKKGLTYFVYVVANLDDSNCPDGTVDSFFDDVETYGDLKRKHLQIMEKTPRDLGKMIMATTDIVPVSLRVGSTVFEPTITLQRLQSKFVVTIYNRVNSESDHTVASGVYPSTLNAADLPRYSFLFERAVPDYSDGKYDYAFNLPNVADGYYESQTDFLPEVEGVVERNGKWYTKQTVEFFSFENRRGSNPDINDYSYVDKDYGTVPNIYGRKALAPEFSTYLRLTSLTQGNALHTYIHAGKGRDGEATSTPDDITNFDVDRSCVYHFNVYINSANDVDVDTRRSFLNQLVIYTLPDVRRIDAHYMDIPSFILGTTPGYVKLQSGTCDVDANGNIIYDGLEPRNWAAMQDSWEDAKRWLRFSWTTPYNPSSRPINTSLYVGMTNVDGVTGATPILHFNEYVDDVQAATIPAVNPERRTAVIRVGFVAGATSSATYDEGVEALMESAFYVPVSQYGLKTIGYLGGFEDGFYTSLLGVESVEEYTFRYYSREEYPMDIVNNGPYWRYRNGIVNHNQPYNGLLATKDHYEDYRGLFPGGIPPKRWDDVTIPEAGMYNPQSNTNAADYCMRKNRDEDGNGIIEGDEVKWYLPTPVQVMQMYIWRNAFKGGNYTLNFGYVPFGGASNGASNYYWTTNEVEISGSPTAYGVDFSKTAALTTTLSKNSRYPVRCVRDIPSETPQSMFYYQDGHLVVNLEGSFPNLATNKPNLGANELNSPANNTLAKAFLVSRWYATANANHTGEPGMVAGNNNLCDNYSETNYPSGKWFLPSQQELSLIYAYSGMIENLLEQAIGGTPNTSTTYHTFRLDRHWGITNTGSNNEFWNVDFSTGAAQTLHKAQNTGYYRCVYYLSELPGT